MDKRGFFPEILLWIQRFCNFGCFKFALDQCFRISKLIINSNDPTCISIFGQGNAHIYLINPLSFIHLLCDLIGVPRLKATFKETLTTQLTLIWRGWILWVKFGGTLYINYKTFQQQIWIPFGSLSLREDLILY